MACPSVLIFCIPERIVFGSSSCFSPLSGQQFSPPPPSTANRILQDRVLCEGSVSISVRCGFMYMSPYGFHASFVLEHGGGGSRTSQIETGTCLIGSGSGMLLCHYTKSVNDFFVIFIFMGFGWRWHFSLAPHNSPLWATCRLVYKWMLVNHVWVILGIPPSPPLALTKRKMSI